MKKLFFALLLGAALLLTACGAGEAKPASAQTDASQGTVMDTAVTAAPSEESIVQRASLIELLDWIREYVTIATAGSSLRSARAAAELLDWAADCTLTEEELAAVYAAWQPAQKEEYPADVTEQLSAVDYAVTKGLFKGTSKTTFSPSDSMTRGMIVTVLYRLAGCPAVSGASGFIDVKASAWYGRAVIWAAKKNIVTGVGNGRFAPNEPVTREQLATILYNYTRSIGKLGALSNKSLGGFADGGNVSSFAQKPMLWAVQQGLIKGSRSGTQYYLSPKSTATRAEVAEILMRYARAYYR